MLATAKVFSTGNSQAVRLPKAFRVNATEMGISKNEVTGESTLKLKDDPGRNERIAELIRTINEDPLPQDFLSEESRLNDPPRNPFEDWEEPASNAPHHVEESKEGRNGTRGSQ